MGRKLHSLQGLGKKTGAFSAPFLVVFTLCGRFRPISPVLQPFLEPISGFLPSRQELDFHRFG